MNGLRQKNNQPAVLLIDELCLLCNAITRFVVKRDKLMAFQFASLQSEDGQRLLIEGHLPIGDINTFVMVQGGKYYTKSDAALRAFRKLDGLWVLLYVFIVVPLAWRNLVYDFIACNRYRWFRRRANVCLLPTPEVKARFLANGIQAAEREALPDEN